VRGFHFVCPAELDVHFEPDGSFRTGIWAVAVAVAERALAAGAYVALHNTKSERSYRQGTLKGWRQLARKGKRIPYGIEFIISPNNIRLSWRGGGSGERGYYYGEDE
jgi:predicted hotdog family 3-hydroxylacyl-ACP dehydratase